LLEMFADAGKELAWVQLPGAEDSAWPIEFGVSRRIDLRASGGMDELRRWLATARHGTRGIVQGEPFTEETTDIRFLWVKGGSFDMGMKGVAEPVHRVNLSPYWLAETPVTNAQYAKFLAEVPGYQEPLYWRDRRFSGEKQPVVGVTWDDANLFCVWLSQQAALLEAGVRVVLPSEAQWELAARGNDGRRFPWGNSPPDPTRAVYGRKDGTVRVGSCPAGQGPLGHLDLVGNVWQWCRNRWDDEADEWQPRGGISEPVEPNREDIRVLRGSPWTHDGVLPAAERRRLGGRGRSGGGGFRVAAVPEIG
jgi:formylglycine-generating enzyme required for sulfatase activity